MKRLMLDLETMGTGPNAAIVAIGCCEFDETAIGRQFYRIVDLASDVEAGGIMDASTVLWWLKQSEEARAELQRKGEHIETALHAFSQWVCGVAPDGDVEIWGNGATFGNVILRSAYTRLKMSAPWSYRDDRCFRTVKALAPPVDTSGWETVLHNALEDAKWQARYLQEVWRRTDLPLLPPRSPACPTKTRKSCTHGVGGRRDEYRTDKRSSHQNSHCMDQRTAGQPRRL